MYISAYIADLNKREMVSSSVFSPLFTVLTSLQQNLTDLDKIATTPIPSAYSAHLRITVWAYLLFLPFQIYPTLKWVTIPATAIAATVYMGFLEIGAQIEMPFAYDQSDLDLDKFVLKIAHQLAEVTAVGSLCGHQTFERWFKLIK
jgi:putative membrane protein